MTLLNHTQVKTTTRHKKGKRINKRHKGVTNQGKALHFKIQPCKNHSQDLTENLFLSNFHFIQQNKVTDTSHKFNNIKTNKSQVFFKEINYTTTSKHH